MAAKSLVDKTLGGTSKWLRALTTNGTGQLAGGGAAPASAAFVEAAERGRRRVAGGVGEPQLELLEEDERSMLK